jgi:quinol-cytochrome oxidoreductase complex cytochrome b subunit
MLGMLMVHDPVVPISGMLVLYTTSANITIAYNLGAIGGMAYGLQVASGILVAMTYVASDEYSFPTLDGRAYGIRTLLLHH